jgi:hypothetical protein
MLLISQFILQGVRISGGQVIVAMNAVQVAAPGQLDDPRQRNSLTGNAVKDILAELGIIQ